jgi:hypothetical protein
VISEAIARKREVAELSDKLAQRYTRPCLDWIQECDRFSIAFNDEMLAMIANAAEDVVQILGKVGGVNRTIHFVPRGPNQG